MPLTDDELEEIARKAREYVATRPPLSDTQRANLETALDLYLGVLADRSPLFRLDAS